MRRFLLAAVAVLVLAASASADDIRVPLTVRPGNLALAPSDGLTRRARVLVTVTDARGHGAGWTLMARVAGPSLTLAVTGVETRCAADSTCTLPRTRVRYPVVLSALRAVPVLDALRGTGMGSIVVTIRLGAQAPGNSVLKFAVRAS